MRLHPAARRLLATALVLPLAVGIAACSGDDGDDAEGTTTTTEAPAGSDTTAPPDSNGEASVVAQGIAFAGDLTVGPGEPFVFDNQDATAHTLTADDGAFDSGTVPGSNQSDPMTAPDEPGDYGFHCEIHPSMTGTLTVE